MTTKLSYLNIKRFNLVKLMKFNNTFLSSFNSWQPWFLLYSLCLLSASSSKFSSSSPEDDDEGFVLVLDFGNTDRVDGSNNLELVELSLDRCGEIESNRESNSDPKPAKSSESSLISL